MTRERSQLFKAFLAGVLFLAWLVAANRCPLTMLLTHSHAVAVQSHCCGTAPMPVGKPGEKAECCRALDLLPPGFALAANSAPTWVELPVFDGLLSLFEEEPAARVVAVASDTGPPEVRSFAERVLQESLRSHAPPRLI